MTLVNGRDLALIYFIIIAFVIALIPGVILGGAAYGLRILKRKLLTYFKLAQHYARRTAQQTDHFATLTVRPIIAASATGERAEFHANQIWNRLIKRLDRKERHQK